MPQPATREGRRDRARAPASLNWLEAGLIVLMLLMLFGGGAAIRTANRNSRALWQTTPATPTPLIQPMLLPSEHNRVDLPIIDDARELFVHGYLQPITSISAGTGPTPVPEFATRIRIPNIDVDAPIVHGVEKEQLKRGVGHIPGTAAAGERGNLVLSAHNDVYGELFRYLDRLRPGDEFTVFTNVKSYTYVVTGSQVVEPTQVEVLAPTPDATATLISCYPYLIDNFRIIVKARLREA